LEVLAVAAAAALPQQVQVLGLQVRVQMVGQVTEQQRPQQRQVAAAAALAVSVVTPAAIPAETVALA
jgi:hypothetical protein